MFKNKNGITLIVLVITIIVLLILAAVTINMVLGDNGLFNKAKTSISKYENAQEKENSTLIEYEQGIDNVRETVTISKEEYNQMKAQINALSNYSKDEQVVGTWINGKPLYQKTIVAQAPTVTTDGVGAQRDVDLSSLKIDFGMIVDGTIQTETHSGPINSAWGIVGETTTAKYYFRVGLYPMGTAANQFFIQTNRIALSDVTVYATIKYTKTTDSATI